MFWLNLFLDTRTLVASIIFIIFIFLFDFVRECRNCGSRFSQTIVRIEILKLPNKFVKDKTIWRQCLLCRHRMLLKKTSKPCKSLAVRL